MHLKISLLLLFLSTCFSEITAQGFRGELIGGIAGSQVSGDNLGGFNKAGLLAGIGVRTKTGDKTELGFRMLYLQKGSRKPLKNDGTDSAYYLLRLNYIELPLTLKYFATKRLGIEAGPSLGYLVSSYEEDENGELEINPPFDKLDFSINLLISYKLGTRTDFIFGYWQSVLPIREHSSGSQYRLNRGQYSSLISFGILYTFRKVKESEKE